MRAKIITDVEKKEFTKLGQKLKLELEGHLLSIDHRPRELAFQPVLDKQRIAYSPSLHPRSSSPESASSPVITEKRGKPDSGSLFRGYRTLLRSSSYLVEAEKTLLSLSGCD